MLHEFVHDGLLFLELGLCLFPFLGDCRQHVGSEVSVSLTYHCGGLESVPEAVADFQVLQVIVDSHDKLSLGLALEFANICLCGGYFLRVCCQLVCELAGSVGGVSYFVYVSLGHGEASFLGVCCGGGARSAELPL